jgi:hypothetical protein
MTRPTFQDSIQRRPVRLSDGREGRLWHCSDNGTVVQVQFDHGVERVPVADIVEMGQ